MPSVNAIRASDPPTMTRHCQRQPDHLAPHDFACSLSKLCKDIDERVGAFLDRPLSGDWPYLWLDATYLRQREGGRIVSVAAIIAVACDAEGHGDIVGLHIVPSEAEAFRATFLKSLV